ncbi:MAG: hypothetical protein KKB50_06730 [Planctomycetes bacterium]|nr:hypothetical protein [Planctomycetota bacterium]
MKALLVRAIIAVFALLFVVTLVGCDEYNQYTGDTGTKLLSDAKHRFGIAGAPDLTSLSDGTIWVEPLCSGVVPR